MQRSSHWRKIHVRNVNCQCSSLAQSKKTRGISLESLCEITCRELINLTGLILYVKSGNENQNLIRSVFFPPRFELLDRNNEHKLSHWYHLC